MAFGDGIERAVCTAYRRWEPEGFPIQHRTGLATRRITEVARRAEATLFCDGAHAGPHIWPDGETVDDVDDLPLTAGSARSAASESSEAADFTAPTESDFVSHTDNGTQDEVLDDETNPEPASEGSSDDDL